MLQKAERSGDPGGSAWSRGGGVSHMQLILGFFWIGLLGFGGVAAIARHEIVRRRGWLTDAEYGEVLSLGNILPGANTVNSAVLIGDRFAGWTGAAVALASLMAIPIVIVIGLLIAYDEFSHVPAVATGLQGIAAAAAGMVLGTSLRLFMISRRTAHAIAFGLLAVIGSAWLRLPLAWVLLALVPTSIISAFLMTRRP
jgi:chromate transporter